MPISDIVNIVISLQTAQALAAGFGIPLIASAHTHNTDRIRFYSSTAGAVSDGFATTEPEYLMLNTIFSQNPAPTKVAIGRRLNRPTMRWAITPVVKNSFLYKLKFNGTAVTYTSDSSATATEIIGGLKTAADLLSLALTTSDQTTYLRVLETVAGAYHTLESPDTASLGIAQDNADAGIAADLDAIKTVDNSWYAVLTPYKSFAENQAIATWTEANEKLFLCETQDSDVVNTAVSGATDIGATVKTQALVRTAVVYHQGDGSNAAAAWAGKVLPMDPGSETWKFKTLAGVTPTPLTDTQLLNAQNKNVNTYTTLAGINMMAEGKVAGDDWIDTIRGRDWLKSNMGARVITALANAKKVPYTDHGAVIIENEVRAALQDAVDVGFLTDNPKPTVTVPSVAAQGSSNRQARSFPNLNFAGQLAGAIHKVGINGTVTP